MKWNRASVAILTLAVCALRASAQNQEQFIPEETHCVEEVRILPTPEIEVLTWVVAISVLVVVPLALTSIAAIERRSLRTARLLGWSGIAVGAVATVFLVGSALDSMRDSDTPLAFLIVQFAAGPMLIGWGFRALWKVQRRPVRSEVSASADATRLERRKAGVTLPKP
jgi:hypothetical protein